MTKKPTGGKRSQSGTPAPRLKKAVPPPDNPMLRGESDELGRGGGNLTDEEMAKLRAKALEEAKEEDT